MTIEIGDNGLRSRYEWTTHEVEPDSPPEAAYQAVRSQRPFLTDDNHTWEAKDYGPTPEDASESIKRLKALTQSSRYAIIINHKEDVGPYGSKYWMSVAYRVPGQPC